MPFNTIHFSDPSAEITYVSTVKHLVKAGEAISKGQAVYVTGSTGQAGTNMIVGKASNSAEATSSKTMGLLETSLSTNGIGYVITEGLLSGLDTSAAGAAGDPVWLGTNGNLIFGLANKPSAPAHLVFIGIVTRKQQNNGEIFVKVQNGFEIEELHNVAITNKQNGDLISYDSATSLWKNNTNLSTLATKSYVDSGLSALQNQTGTLYVAFADVGVENGVAPLGPDALIPAQFLPTTIATKTYVDTAISNLVDAAPTTLNTLNELAAALNNDANFATTITNQISLKAEYPSQTGNNGKFLKTDGTSVSWAAIPSPADATPTVSGLVKGKIDSNTNVGIGTNVFLNSLNGQYNTAVGDSALKDNEENGNFNAAFGASALQRLTTGDGNIAIGSYVADYITTGNNNIVMGSLTGRSITSGYSNIGIGGGSLGGLTTGYQNVALGINALQSLSAGATNNLAVGHSAGASISTGSANTLIGFNVAYGFNTGSNSIIIGNLAQPSSTSASNEITLGNTNITKFRIPGLGVEWSAISVPKIDIGVAYGSVSFGENSGLNMISNTGNTFIGDKSAGSGSGGSLAQFNTGVGVYSLYSLSSGVRNVAIGYDSAYSVYSGRHNVAIGGEDTFFTNQYGSWNVAIGSLALYKSTTSYNTAIGSWAGEYISTGQYNTLLGYQAGTDGSNGLTTGSNNTIIGNGSMPSSYTVSNQITLGNSSITSLRCQVTTITGLSDARDKKNIEPLQAGLGIIKQLKPVQFEWNMRDGGKVGEQDIGFIAQDLIEVEDASGLADYLKLTYRDNPEKLEASSGRLIPIMIKAIQELSDQVTELKSKLA